MKTKNIFPLFFVFSSEEDHQLFEMKEKIHSIILPHTSLDGIINKKKLFGLHCLQSSSYDFILVMDAESDFIEESFSETRLRETIERIFQRKLFFGKNIDEYCEMKTMRLVMKSCISLFPSDVWTPLLEETQNLTLYSWWSDLPVYKRDTIHDFLSYIDFQQLQWEHFDHLLYTYYLIAYQGFHLRDVSFCLESKEPLDTIVSVSENELLSLQEQGLSFLYINYALEKAYSDFFKKIGTIFICHLDRKHLESDV